LGNYSKLYLGNLSMLKAGGGGGGGTVETNEHNNLRDYKSI
jgi:hypothetical protein